MLIKKLGTVSLLAASIMLLDGCNILSDLFGGKKEEPVVVQPEKPATHPKGQANKKNGSRKPRKDNSGRNPAAGTAGHFVEFSIVDLVLCHFLFLLEKCV